MKLLKILIPIVIASIALVAGACSGTDTAISGVETSVSTSTETTSKVIITATTLAEANELGLEIIGETYCEADVGVVFPSRELCFQTRCKSPHYLTNLEGVDKEVCVREIPDVVDYAGAYVPNVPDGYTPAKYIEERSGRSYAVDYLGCTYVVLPKIGGLRFVELPDEDDSELTKAPRGDECFDRCYFSYQTIFGVEDENALIRLCRFETGFGFPPYSEGERVLFSSERLDIADAPSYTECVNEHLNGDGCDAYFSCFTGHVNTDTTNTNNIENLPDYLTTLFQKYINKDRQLFESALENRGISNLEAHGNSFHRLCSYNTGIGSNVDYNIRVRATSGF